MGLWSRFQRRVGDLAGELVLDDYRDQLLHADRLVRRGLRHAPATFEGER